MDLWVELGVSILKSFAQLGGRHLVLEDVMLAMI